MKPQRLAATHSLVVSYDLHRSMQMFRANRATAHDLTRFHSEDYIEFLQRVAPNSADQYEHLFNQFNIGEDWLVMFFLVQNNCVF